jgi:hypothetical protein
MARPLREVAHLGEVVEELLQGSIDLSIGSLSGGEANWSS